MNTKPTSEPFITICRQLNLDLRAYLNMHATRPQLPPSLLSGGITTKAPRIARTPAARAAIAAAEGTTFCLPFAALANHPAGTICWRLDPSTAHGITGYYTITAADFPPAPKTCAQCRFCHPVTDLPPDAPSTCAFCDCPPSAGGDGIAYAIHSDLTACHNFQPKN